MGSYTRVLTTQADCIPIPALAKALKEESCRAIIQTDDDPETWEQAVLTLSDGPEIAAIERNAVSDRSLGDEELQEFREELEGALPKSGANWLREFFPRVRCIYAFQHLSGTEKRAGFSALSVVRNALWSAAPAILQADGEGFSNEEFYVAPMGLGLVVVAGIYYKDVVPPGLGTRECAPGKPQNPPWLDPGEAAPGQ